MNLERSKVLTVEQQDYICESIAAGMQIRTILATLGLTVYRFYDYIDKDPLFDKRVETARVYQQYLKVDELLSVTDGCNTMPEVAKAKVISDNTKWTAGKFVPARFGENLNVNVSHHLDLSSVLLAAENRIIPILQAKNALSPQKAALEDARSEAIDVDCIPETVSIAPVATDINNLSVSPSVPSESGEVGATVGIDATGAIPKEWI